MEDTVFSTFGEGFQLAETLPVVVYNPFRQKVPIKAWLRTLEDSAQEQILGLANLSVVRGHVAIMPDAHMGIGCSVGTVFATVDAVVPSTVGVDLGCGMIAMRFPDADVAKLEQDKVLLRRLHTAIRACIPTGMGEHKKGQDWEGFSTFPLKKVETILHGKSLDFEKIMYEKGRNQLGSLGGGNHFIELCIDADQVPWFMLHSGSRGLGNIIGNHFMHKAKAWCNETHQKRPKELDFLPVSHPEGARYVDAVHWAQEYARQNRLHMVGLLMDLLGGDPAFESAFFGKEGVRKGRSRLFTVENHHNFVQPEEHFGEKVWVHRKGAVSARLGEWSILPGSMATGSYIVQGRGNAESLCSCAHGSGRKMSRSAAKREISLKEVEAAMKGIVGEDAAQVLDEAPQAYKDLETVMRQQEDLIQEKYRLRPVLNVKGY